MVPCSLCVCVVCFIVFIVIPLCFVRLSQWSYGPVSKHLYDVIGVDYAYPPEYYDHIEFEADVNARKQSLVKQNRRVITHPETKPLV